MTRCRIQTFQRMMKHEQATLRSLSDDTEHPALQQRSHRRIRRSRRHSRRRNYRRGHWWIYWKRHRKLPSRPSEQRDTHSNSRRIIVLLGILALLFGTVILATWYIQTFTDTSYGKNSRFISTTFHAHPKSDAIGFPATGVVFIFTAIVILCNELKLGSS